MEKKIDAVVERIKYSAAEAFEDGGKCGDCGVSIGSYHVEGCDLETCEHCGRQRIWCGCGDTTETSGEAA